MYPVLGCPDLPQRGHVSFPGSHHYAQCLAQYGFWMKWLVAWAKQLDQVLEMWPNGRLLL
jgi:hypothetical protein